MILGLILLLCINSFLSRLSHSNRLLTLKIFLRLPVLGFVYIHGLFNLIWYLVTVSIKEDHLLNLDRLCIHLWKRLCSLRSWVSLHPFLIGILFFLSLPCHLHRHQALMRSLSLFKRLINHPLISKSWLSGLLLRLLFKLSSLIVSCSYDLSVLLHLLFFLMLLCFRNLLNFALWVLPKGIKAFSNLVS